MKKSEAKSGIFGRASSSASSTPSPSGICVNMYGDLDGDQTLVVDECGKTFDAEQLCYMAVEKLGISPPCAPLFSLKCRFLHTWCPPNEKILCAENSPRHFDLRVRFIPADSVVEKLPHVDSKMFDYLYLQIRSDFIKDRISYRGESIGQEHLLGLAVIDMVRYGKQHGANLAALLNLSPRNFIPASAKNKFKFFLDKKRLQMNFKPYLEKEHKQFESDSVVTTQLTYINGIAEYAERYGTETFRIVGSSGTDKVVVMPFDSEFPGIKIYEGKVRTGRFVFLFFCFSIFLHSAMLVVCIVFVISVTPVP